MKSSLAVVVLSLLLCPPGSGFAESVRPHTPYKISHRVVASGGTRQTDTNHIHFGTVGQSVIGVVDTIPFRNEVGFWYQPGYVITSVDPDEDQPPRVYRLDQNYPNPFNPATSIRFALPKRSHVSLKIYDVLGREVATVVDEELKRGLHRVTWDARHLASGVYFYRIQAGGFVQTKKLVVLK